MITVETKTFHAHLERFAVKAKGRMEALAREFCSDLAEEVVRETPVITGFLRNSWHASINAAPAHAGQDITAATGKGDVARVVMTGNGPAVANSIKLGDVFYFTNGASYAVFVEYGTSKMAPRSFVRRTVARAPQIAEAAAHRIGGN